MKRWIKGKNGKAKQVEARSCGVRGLFINQDPKLGKKGGWAITHRASGLRVGPYYFHSPSDAIAMAETFTQEHEIDWTIKDPQELVDTYFGMSKWWDDLVKVECDADEYSEHP